MAKATKANIKKAIDRLKELTTPGPRVRVSMQHCELFSSEAMICPLCKLTIPPFTSHVCG